MRTYYIRIPGWIRRTYPSATWSVRPEDGIIWTIDDGPHPGSTLAWLEFLDQYSIKAYFFITGQKAEKYPELIKAIKNEGHLIGSHGYLHINGWKTSFEEYVSDVERSLELLDTRIFRPPYGRMTWPQYLYLKKKCELYMWSLMPGDFDHRVTPAVLIERLALARRGDIIVFHDRPECLEKLDVGLQRIAPGILDKCATMVTQSRVNS